MSQQACFWCGKLFEYGSESEWLATCSKKCEDEWMAAEADSHFNDGKDEPSPDEPRRTWCYAPGDSDYYPEDEVHACEDDRFCPEMICFACKAEKEIK